MEWEREKELQTELQHDKMIQHVVFLISILKKRQQQKLIAVFTCAEKEAVFESVRRVQLNSFSFIASENSCRPLNAWLLSNFV